MPDNDGAQPGGHDTPAAFVRALRLTLGRLDGDTVLQGCEAGTGELIEAFTGLVICLAGKVAQLEAVVGPDQAQACAAAGSALTTTDLNALVRGELEQMMADVMLDALDGGPEP